jgi:hypothetical protein
MEAGEMTKKAAVKTLSDWLNNGVLSVDIYDTHNKLKGLKVEKWPD